jgi:sugar O-acyltransferase (sialic acid O-acetyltransferase NeuD family)
MNENELRPVVIFGLGELAQLAHYYFTHDSPRTVAAFTVDRAFLPETTWTDLPVVAFEDLEDNYPPGEYDLFIAIGYVRLNQARTEKYQEGKARGYQMATYVSSRATCYPDLVLGDNCLIMEGNQIQPFATIGNNVVIWSSSFIGHHVEIGDNCFIAAHAVISGKVRVGANCFIGVSATVREKIELAKDTIVGAGALIMHSTEENTSYLGTASKNSGIPSHKLQSLL